jgi:hypothetical protein
METDEAGYELTTMEVPLPEILSPALRRSMRLGEQLAFMANYFSRTQVTQADELRELRGFRDLVDQLAHEVLGCSCCSLEDGPGGEEVYGGNRV